MTVMCKLYWHYKTLSNTKKDILIIFEKPRLLTISLFQPRMDRWNPKRVACASEAHIDSKLPIAPPVHAAACQRAVEGERTFPLKPDRRRQTAERAFALRFAAIVQMFAQG